MAHKSRQSKGTRECYEFVPYPDYYPADTTRIEVTGVFDSYEEFGWTYYRLVADDVTIL